MGPPSFAFRDSVALGLELYWVAIFFKKTKLCRGFPAMSSGRSAVFCDSGESRAPRAPGALSLPRCRGVPTWGAAKRECWALLR